MKKSFAAPLLTTVPALVKMSWVKTCAYAAVLLTLGCTNTQVRLDATRMRQDVMVYYNDQIMDNLIRANNKLPFVHVDIQLLTSQGGSQITGMIGAGQTPSFTRTSRNSSIGGALATVSRAVMRPFSYSVTPQQTETLSITAAPALGSQAVASPTPSRSPTPTPTPTPTPMEITKVTEVRGASATPGEKGPLEKTITEETPKASKPKTITIYELYEDFAQDPPKGHLSHNPIEPEQGTYVPGTLKKWSTKGHTEYYFIADADKEDYYRFCKALFTKGQSGSLEKQLETTRAELETVKTQLAAPSLR